MMSNKIINEIKNIKINDKEKMYHYTNFSYNCFTYKEYVKHKKTKTREAVKYIDLIANFDSETAWNHDEENPKAWIYLWSMCINGQSFYGRNVLEFMDFLKKIKKSYDLNDNKKMLIYIHNLSYDMEYLIDFLIDTFNDEGKLLALKPHSIISYEIGGFEFRCSYKLTNKSLKKWSDDLKTKHKKLCGNLDYDEIYYPDDTLNNLVLSYMFNDTFVPYECMIKQLDLYKDNLATIPLTITGYVRRFCRNEFKRKTEKACDLDILAEMVSKFTNAKLNRDDFKKSKQTTGTILMLKKAFSGGVTHVNRFMVNLLIKLDIRHRDFRSHYPSQLMCKKYPMGKFYNVLKEDLTLENIIKTKDTKATLVEIVFYDVVIKNNVSFPYIQKSKMEINKEENVKYNKPVFDNGRLLKFEGIFTITLTELDLEILLEQYIIKGGYIITKCYQAKKDYLPYWFRKCINNFFKNKTVFKQELKDFKEGSEEYWNKSIDLMISKGMLNAIYGMTASYIIRQIIGRGENGEWFSKDETNLQEIVDKYYDNENSFMRYEWGVWNTAYCRYELYEYIKTIGYENAVYCDTDSIFYVTSEEIEEKIEKLNEKKLKEALDLGCYIEDIKGNKVNYDCFEMESHKYEDGHKGPEIIKEFKALHAKCYILRRDDDSVSLTLAGVTAKSRDYEEDGITRELELFGVTTKRINDKIMYCLDGYETFNVNDIYKKGNIDNLKGGFVFKKCGGSRVVYNKEPKITTEIINGHEVTYAGFAIILPTEKTISENVIEYFDNEEVF